LISYLNWFDVKSNCIHLKGAVVKYWIKLFIIAFSLFTVTGLSHADVPREGLQYTQFPTAIQNAPEVMELFSLTCSHCPKMEVVLPTLEVLTASEINQVHVVFNDSARSAAFIYYAAAVQTYDQPDREMVKALFAYVQSCNPQSKNLASNKLKLTNLFSQYGLLSPDNLPRDQLQRVVEKMELSEAMVNVAQLRSIPALIVQGRYLVTVRAHKSIDELANTINYLKSLE